MMTLKTITHEQLEKLKKLEREATARRAVLEQMARECCIILDIDPDADTYEANTARSIVEAGVCPICVTAKLVQHWQKSQA